MCVFFFKVYQISGLIQNLYIEDKKENDDQDSGNDDNRKTDQNNGDTDEKKDEEKTEDKTETGDVIRDENGVIMLPEVP